MRYLSAGTHPITGSNCGSLFKLSNQNKPRLGLWVQKWYWDTESEAKALVELCKEIGITDVFLMAVDYDTSPYKLMGYAASCSNNITSLRFSGMYPFDFMAQACNALGIQVHAWFIMYYFAWWHGATTSFLNSPLGLTYRDDTSNPSVYMWKIFEATARASVVDALQSFYKSNKGVGIHLDYIRADGTSDAHTAANITSLVSEIRNGAPGAIISICSITNGYAEDSGANTINQRPRDWVDSGNVDQVHMMGYTYGFGYKGRQMGQIPGKGKGVMFSVGFSAETERNRINDVACRIQLYQAHGYHNFTLFDSRTDHWDQTTYKRLARAINQTGDINVLYPDSLNITSLQINQGTNVIIGHDGGTDTVTWAQMGIPGATPAEIKANVESIVGHSVKPFVFYYDGTYLRVGIGDFHAE